MTLNVRINNRNFTTQPIKPVSFQVKRLAWTAYGGPDQATITAQAPYERLLDFVSLLRCPLTVTDHTTDPVWWGFISKIKISFQHVQATVSIEDLFNKVKVLYSYLSPDSIQAELYDTGFSGSALSQAEYGIKERVLFRESIDDSFALALRDTFLKLTSFPRTQLKPSKDLEVPTITITAQGWFHTLGWRFYENKEGFYANHGPGPGQQAFGDGTTSAVVQRFLVSQNVDALYAYFMIRKQGAPTTNVQARLYTHSAGFPSGIIADSIAFAGAGLSTVNFQWIKFTFATPQPLTAGNYYFIGLVSGSSSSTNHYVCKTDENMSFSQMLWGLRYTTAWVQIVPAVVPGSLPHLYFRMVCSRDSGLMLKDLADATSEFFTGIQTFSSGVLSTPYKVNRLTTLQEIRTLMKLGTVNQRPILADVDIDRRLRFYEAPDPAAPTAYLDPQGRYFTSTKQLLPPWRPPIGQYAMLSGVDRLSVPFDLKRTPAYFVDRFVYTCKSTR
jgi:hypothetical protein